MRRPDDRSGEPTPIGELTRKLARRPPEPQNTRSFQVLQRIAEQDLHLPPGQDAIAFTCSLLTRISWPYKDPKTNEFARRNGPLSVLLQGQPGVGIPYGRYPRLLVTFICTEALRTGDKRLYLGNTFTGFLNKIGIAPSGGKTGPRRGVLNQLHRLLTTTLSVTWTQDQSRHQYADVGFRISFRTQIQFDPSKPDQPALWGSAMELSEDFYRQIVEHPVPISLPVLKALTPPMAMDLYVWATHRSHCLALANQDGLSLTWHQLADQFGTTDNLRGFRRTFKQNLELVQQVYPALQLRLNEKGILLFPSPPHVKPVLDV